MRVLEFKAKTTKHQRLAIDQAIRTGQFVQNKALRLWMDVRGVNLSTGIAPSTRLQNRT